MSLNERPVLIKQSILGFLDFSQKKSRKSQFVGETAMASGYNFDCGTLSLAHPLQSKPVVYGSPCKPG